MTEPVRDRRRHTLVRILAEFSLPVVGFTFGVGLATGNWPVSFVTGVAISLAISALYWLDQRFLHPSLERLPQDWIRMGLEMTFLLLDHVVGAVLALIVSSRLFGFQGVPAASWLPVAAMVAIFPIIHGTEMALRYFRQVQEKEKQEERLRALAAEAELKALKAQINPHFLFNTLNTIAELIHTDSERAEKTVERLAEMFRYVLTGSERISVPLEEELAFVDSYLQIEQARFGEHLRVTREVDRDALGASVPGLILQPLVENAIGHGRGGNGRIDLTIHVGLGREDVIIAVGDTGPGMPSNFRIGASPGYGLHNVDQRLRKTYGETYTLDISANHPQGTVVTLRIPLEKRT
jgi:signal transduction histidine kinase